MRKRTTDRRSHGTPTRAVSRAVAALAVAASLSCPCLAADQKDGSLSESQLAAALESAERLVADVIDRYESESSYRITFSQDSYWALADTMISSTGVLLLERPSMLAVRYSDGSAIVSNGDTLTVYMSQTNQYFVTPVGTDDTVIDPPKVLRSYVPDPAAPFAKLSVGVVDYDSNTTRTVESTLALIPADGTAEPARLEVTVDPGRNLVTGMVAHTRSGDFTRYRISETRFGVDTSSADFVIEIPRGAERIGG